MIGVKRYVPADYKVLLEWWKQWGEVPVPEEYLSQTGFMVENVAAGFLYTTDSKMGIVENFITNKNTDKDIRDYALDLIIATMLDVAKQMEMGVVVACSDLKVILSRSKKFNFVIDKKKYRMMSRRI